MKKLLLSTAVVAILAFSGTAQAASDTATATATVVEVMGCTKGVDMLFGSFALDDNTSTGTVDTAGVAGDSNVFRTSGTTVQAATFDVTGAASETYTISVSAVNLTGSGDTMTLTPAASAASVSGTVTNPTLSTSGTDVITVNGVLTVNAGQAAAADYTGSVTVIVNYG